MTLYSLASSSSGNSYLYEFGNIRILIDIGISYKKVKESLRTLNLLPSDITSVFLTHEHIDHVRGLAVFKKNNPNIDVSATDGTMNALTIDMPSYNTIKGNEEIVIGDLKILPINISHDANEPVGFIFTYKSKKYAHILDTGYLPIGIKNLLKGMNFYLIESNYEEQALLTNPAYPHHLKKRINSDVGHLSNKQANQYIRELITSETEIVCYGHLSEKNNEYDLVDIINASLKGIQKHILKKDEVVVVSCK